MRNRMNIMVVVGLVLALAVGVGVYKALQRHTATVMVVVAKEYIPHYAKITPQMVTVASAPPAAVPPGGLADAGLVVGHYAAATIFPGQIVVAAAVASQASGGSAGLLAALSPNIRAFSVQATVPNAVAGQVAPGDLVDVVSVLGSSGTSNSSSAASGAVTVVQHVTVLAVSPPTGGPIVTSSKSSSTAAAGAQGSQSGNVYTLALTPSQVQLVALAENSGTLFLSLDPSHGATTFSGTPTQPAAFGSAQVGPTPPHATTTHAGTATAATRQP